MGKSKAYAIGKAKRKRRKGKGKQGVRDQGSAVRPHLPPAPGKGGEWQEMQGEKNLSCPRKRRSVGAMY